MAKRNGAYDPVVELAKGAALTADKGIETVNQQFPFSWYNWHYLRVCCMICSIKAA